MSIAKESYTTVMHFPTGYCAVLIAWYETDSMWDIHTRSETRHPINEEADEEALEWADAIGVKFHALRGRS